MRQVWPLWLGSILVPLADLIFFWNPDDGRCTPMGLFFIGCASLTTYTFRPAMNRGPDNELESREQAWRYRMAALGMALLAASTVFSLLWLMLINARDFAAVFLAFSIIFPSLCIAPCFTLLTRKPFAAVVFTVFAVAATKLLGCLVVVFVYGWHADSHVPPYTDMPWENPNLLVCLFLLNTAILCAWCYVLGRRKFLTIQRRVDRQMVEEAF